MEGNRMFINGNRSRGMGLRMNCKGGLNRRISSKELQNVEGRLIDFTVGHSLSDILPFISARNDR